RASCGTRQVDNTRGPNRRRRRHGGRWRCQIDQSASHGSIVSLTTIYLETIRIQKAVLVVVARGTADSTVGLGSGVCARWAGRYFVPAATSTRPASALAKPFAAAAAEPSIPCRFASHGGSL